MAGSKHISEFEELLVFDGEEDFLLEKDGITYKAKLKKFNGYQAEILPVTNLTGTEVILLQQGVNNASCTLEQLSDYRRYGKLANIGSVSGPITLDLGSADVFVMTLMGDITVGLTNIPDALPYQFMIRAKQGGNGGYRATWSPLFKHQNGESPVLSTAIGDVDIFIAMCFESGIIEISKTGPFNKRGDTCFIETSGLPLIAVQELRILLFPLQFYCGMKFSIS